VSPGIGGAKLSLSAVYHVYESVKTVNHFIMSLKKVVKLAALVVSLGTTLLTGVVFFRNGVSNVGHVGLVRNRYEAAQHKTVLVVAPDGQGSGVVVKRGRRVFVWTAAHVAADYSEVKIKLFIRNDTFQRVGETVFSGRVIAANKIVDVALIYVDAPAEYFIGAEFDGVVPPLVGTPVYHVGNFLGQMFDGAVSTGILAQVGVAPGGDWPWPVADLTSCPFTNGSSGGPMFRSDNDKILGIVVGGFPGRPIYVYVPVRIIAAWAHSKGLLWAVYGESSPAVLPVYTPPVKVIPDFTLDPE
jgi:S1-C subfamily serine protease